ncbi:MAG: peptide ABC transporter ATP-binding protein, partial [Anaerolineae bacterium]|nr:peptide ABC transporter ATP-binding protein [Anaerolineae bacterium]
PYTRALIAAIPEADPDVTRHKERMRLRSEDIPSLLRLPPGCAFHPRCPYFIDGVCDAHVPILKPADKGTQEVACIPATEGQEFRLYHA